MSDNLKIPILYKGEVYSAPIDKQKVVIPKEPAITYEESRKKLLNDIKRVSESLRTIPNTKRLPNEAILCVRVQVDYAAKAYYPETLFGSSTDLEEIGSRMWRNKENASDDEVGRLFFVRTTDLGLFNFEKKLNRSESDLTKNFKLDVRKISALNLLAADEQVVGFNNDWETGRLEAILHPFSIDRSFALSHFKERLIEAGVQIEECRIKQYEGDGLTFISLPGNKQILSALSGYNPLRTVHPLTFRSLPTLTREDLIMGSPVPPTFTKKPSIVVGVIDGGYKSGNPCLDNYVETVDAVSGEPMPAYQEHGALVTSAVLYGPLHKYKNTDILPEPEVSVRNFRVLSKETDPRKDPDLYSVIDAIEEIVPKNTDIQSYNISLGPIGPIQDDYVSRFTYSLDMLSKKHNILFHVAVGNDGEILGYERIQSPSDIVNGLAVGARTLILGKVEHASYSCKGPGREGNKMKPDITALGGCERFPLQLVGSLPNYRAHTSGTSFASPQSSGLSGRLIGGSKGVVNALMARLLTTHFADGSKGNKHCTLLGHGQLPEDISSMMLCRGNSYTLIYEGDIHTKRYREFEIPWIEELNSGNVHLRWTVTVLTDVDPRSPEDYTSSSVEIVFYPNSYKYTFSKDGVKKKFTVDIEADPTLAAKLITEGWKKSPTPDSDSSEKPYRSEMDLRKNDLKWDSVDIREKGKKVKSIKQPIFQVHAIGRGRSGSERVKFAIALTVDLEKANIDVYPKIRAKYEALLPIQMEINVPVVIKA